MDTETTGLPPRGIHPSNSEAWKQCRMVQIAWELYDANGILLSCACYLVRPEDFVIPAESSRIHGITQEHAIEHGVPLSYIIERLRGVLPSVQKIVAHNMSFDDAVVQSELFRCRHSEEAHATMDMWNSCEKICTMKAACTHPRQKWPKLAELYQRYFGVLPEGTLHRADADVRVCAAIYHYQQRMVSSASQR